MRSSSSAGRPRRSTSWRTVFLRAATGPQRHGARHRDGASRQHRSLAARRRHHGADPDLRQRASSTSARPSAMLRQGASAARRDARLQRSRHHQSGGRTLSHGARRRRAGAGRRRAGRAASRHRCRRRWAAISTVSPGTRCSVRPGSACSGRSREHLAAMPPYQGGGDMIDEVTLRAHDVRAAAPQVRGGHAAHRRRGGARRGARLARQRRIATRFARTKTRCATTPPSGCRRFPACGSSGRAPDKAAGGRVHARRRPSARHRVAARRRRHLRSRRSSLHPAAAPAPRPVGHGARVVRAVQHHDPKSTRWREGLLERARSARPDEQRCRSSTRA